MDRPGQCQGTTAAKRRCKNPSSESGYCWRHQEQKPVTRTNVGLLPPDVLREIVRKMSIKDILAQCLVNRQFNSAICSNLVFWQQLARERELELPDLPGLTIESLPIHALKRYLYEKEHIPKVYYELRQMHFASPHKRLYGFDDPFDEFMPTGVSEMILTDFIAYIQGQYTEYYREMAREDPEELDLVLTPTAFNAKLDKIGHTLKEFDVLDFGYVNGEQPDDLFFIYRRDELMVKPIEARYTAYEFTLFIPEEGFSMLAEVYEKEKQPLTQEMVRKLYPVDGKGVVDEDGDLRLIGDDDDPVTVIGGIPMHITEDFID